MVYVVVFILNGVQDYKNYSLFISLEKHRNNNTENFLYSTAHIMNPTNIKECIAYLGFTITGFGHLCESKN